MSLEQTNFRESFFRVNISPYHEVDFCRVRIVAFHHSHELHMQYLSSLLSVILGDQYPGMPMAHETVEENGKKTIMCIRPYENIKNFEIILERLNFQVYERDVFMINDVGYEYQFKNVKQYIKLLDTLQSININEDEEIKTSNDFYAT